MFLIQSLPVAFNSDRQNNESEERDLPKLKADIDDAVALQQNSPDDAQKMRQRKNFADDLGPVWHAAKGKHETGEQDRREKNKERHLHCLQLVFRDRGKRYAHGEVRDNEDEGDPQEKQDASPDAAN